ncbi:uncharacterized protein LOC107885150 [Acyrthosiphon pisum]|uniref:Uncharacterized protein n=1 Tax=Acyrthosiphon pisum TaxID=7029 RepID=A0A8R2JW50_ACYPI|nr:uncharacterized protein LOC107885150 [Acyrthosiphon pisum]
MAKIIMMAFYLIFIGVLIINVMSYNPLLTYTLRFKKMEVQPNISVDYHTVDRYKEGEFLNAQIKINSKEQVNKAIVIFYRCDSDGINCEYFQTWKFTDLCTKLKQKNQLWSRWYGSFDPPMVCPLDKVRKLY